MHLRAELHRRAISEGLFLALLARIAALLFGTHLSQPIPAHSSPFQPISARLRLICACAARLPVPARSHAKLVRAPPRQGAALLRRFAWLLSVFGFFLLLAGLRIICEPQISDSPPRIPRGRSEHELGAAGEAERPPAICAARMLRHCLPVLWTEETEHLYWARDQRGRLCATKLSVVVLGVTLSDLLFAMDSIPVVLSVTTTPFLLVASQVCDDWLRAQRRR